MNWTGTGGVNATNANASTSTASTGTENNSLIVSGEKVGAAVVNTTVAAINKIKPNTPKPITTYK